MELMAFVLRVISFEVVRVPVLISKAAGLKEPVASCKDYDNSVV